MSQLLLLLLLLLLLPLRRACVLRFATSAERLALPGATKAMDRPKRAHDITQEYAIYSRARHHCSVVCDLVVGAQRYL